MQSQPKASSMIDMLRQKHLTFYVSHSWVAQSQVDINQIGSATFPNFPQKGEK